MAEERRIFSKQASKQASKQGRSASFFCCRYFGTDTFNDCKTVIFAGSIAAKVTAFSASGGVTVKYRIAVFDDEVTGLQKTEEMIQHYAKEHTEHELEISRFTELEPITEAVCDGLKDWENAFQILFMDISLQGRDGIESARCLRKQGFEDIIIFQSSSGECALDAFTVEATHYLVKPVGQRVFDTAMNRAIEKLSHINFIH